MTGWLARERWEGATDRLRAASNPSAASPSTPRSRAPTRRARELGMRLRCRFLALACSAQLAAQQSIALTPGLVITSSVRVRPGTYRIQAPSSLDSATITVRGDNIVVDFAGATLDGGAPDSAQGVALHIEGGTNVT